jgi:hypothetical protein
MNTQWSAWLAAEKAAGRSGVVFSQKPIVRGEAYELVLPIPGDVSGDAFAAAIYLTPDADDSALASFTVDVGSYDSEAGTTDVTLSLAATATDDEPPADADGDGLAEAVFKMTYTPSGGSAARALSLVIPIVE